MKKYSDEFWNKIQSLRNEGVQLQKLAHDYDFNTQTYYIWKRNNSNSKVDEGLPTDVEECHKLITKLQSENNRDKEKIELLKKVLAIVGEDNKE